MISVFGIACLLELLVNQLFVSQWQSQDLDVEVALKGWGVVMGYPFHKGSGERHKIFRIFLV